MHRWWIILLLLGNLGFTSFPSLYQNSIEINDVGAFYSYGETVTFQARVHSPDLVKNLSLFIQSEGQPAHVQSVPLPTDGGIIYTYDLKKTPLLPFARTQYWFRAELLNGQGFTSPAYWFNYDDNRFTWQTLTDSQFEIQWYNRDLSFGQEVLNTAVAGLKSAQSILPVALPSQVRIFVYSSTTDFQSALQLSGQSWIAGHASPELGTIVISIPPGPDASLELERQIPHEIAHLLQYRMAAAAYSRIPNWFLEGTASLAEIYPNPDYQSVLSNASSNGTLIPLNQLCGPFPREASGAFLAYAESTSFVRYLHQNYGTSGLQKLMQQYQDGIGCQEGTARALGFPLNDLEYRWRQQVLGVDMNSLVLSNLAPYLALLGLIIIIPLLVSLPYFRHPKIR